jgi:hypothetical protein
MNKTIKKYIFGDLVIVDVLKGITEVLVVNSRIGVNSHKTGFSGMIFFYYGHNNLLLKKDHVPIAYIEKVQYPKEHLKHWTTK